VARNAAFRRNVQVFAAFYGLFADLRRDKDGIRGFLNWTAENLFLGGMVRCVRYGIVYYVHRAYTKTRDGN
jgi:hypothetical protein